MPFQAHGISG